MTAPNIPAIIAGLSAAQRERDEALRAIGGCSDGYCVIDRPVGMHTNGGCRCVKERPWDTQKALYAHSKFAAAVRSALIERAAK